mgnify:CR=1 FL=1
MNVDTGKQKLQSLISEINQTYDDIISEEGGKIKIVIRMLTEVLAWRHKEISAERKHEDGYSDLIVSEQHRATLLVETKRIGQINLKSTDVNKVRNLLPRGGSLNQAKDGIQQAYKYAAPEGIPVAVLTDGFVWIIFKTFTPGSHYQDKEAFVFPSLRALENDFTIFFELLSKDSFKKKLYVSHFDKVHNKRHFLAKNLSAPIDENEIQINPKNELAFDLDQIFSAFFSRLRGQGDDDMLIECFVETRQSRLADLALEKMTANILGNISSKNRDIHDELQILIENAINVESGQTVFIVGPNGAGKSTFLDRFFRKTLSLTVRRQCVVLNVDCLDSTGREDNVLAWYTEELIKSIEQQIYYDGFPSWDELQGLYFSEYERRRKGVDAFLYESNRDEFKKKFGGYLDEQVEKNREGYLRRLLRDVVDNRRKMPILIIDNTDEFSPAFKKQIFQFSQALRRHVNHCLILMPLTDKSAWAFSKTDIYNIYNSKSFFLPTPPPREVFRKRNDYIRSKLGQFSSEEEKRRYFTSKGIRLSIQNIDGFASVIDELFVRHEYTSKTIGAIANFNIRRTLDLGQRVITSSVFRIEDLLRAYTTSQFVPPDYKKFVNALLKGDYQQYRQKDRHYIFPVFQVDSHVRQSPLVYLRVLQLLESVTVSARSIEDKHLSTQSVIDYFDSMGATEIALNTALKEMLNAGLIESYDPSVQSLSSTQRIAITHSGREHLSLGTHNWVFFEQMALTTGIVDTDTAEKIRSIYFRDDKYSSRAKEIRHLFASYILDEDAAHIHQDMAGDQFENQNELLKAIRKFSGSTGEYEETVFSPDSLKSYEAVGVVVDWYDSEKGFGFVEIERSDDQAFLYVERLKEAGIDRVFDGDYMLCDIGRNEKGLFVERVYDIEEDKVNIEEFDARVIKIFPDRGYGFVNISESTRDAYLHRSVLVDKNLNDLYVGQNLRVKVSLDRTKESYTVRRIVG